MPKVMIDGLHYGMSALLILLAALSYMGVQLPGIHVDPSIALPAGLGVYAAGLKGGK